MFQPVWNNLNFTSFRYAKYQEAIHTVSNVINANAMIQNNYSWFPMFSNWIQTVYQVSEVNSEYQFPMLSHITVKSLSELKMNGARC